MLQNCNNLRRLFQDTGNSLYLFLHLKSQTMLTCKFQFTWAVHECFSVNLTKVNSNEDGGQNFFLTMWDTDNVIQKTITSSAAKCGSTSNWIMGCPCGLLLYKIDDSHSISADSENLTTVLFASHHINQKEKMALYSLNSEFSFCQSTCNWWYHMPVKFTTNSTSPGNLPDIKMGNVQWKTATHQPRAN